MKIAGKRHAPIHLVLIVAPTSHGESMRCSLASGKASSISEPGGYAAYSEPSSDQR